MLSNPARILCIGKDSGLLRSRCAVLAHAGYAAQAVMFAEAESLLRTTEFDLIILSAILSSEERDRISAFIGGTIPILALKKLTFASELLAEIEHQLHRAKQDSVA
jgi:DNA-binding response OmpR family regulator